jgi:hypothetical protein
LGDRTQPQTTTAPTFSDKQFSILLDMLADEKRSRLKLEERVITLENELLATQKGVTNNYYTETKNNENRGQQVNNDKTMMIPNGIMFNNMNNGTMCNLILTDIDFTYVYVSVFKIIK